jgi:hypothetical protein
VSATALRDYAPWEVGAALLIACSVQLAAGVVLYFTRVDVIAAAPEVDKGAQLPVKVQPVLDLDGPLLKLGGKKPVLPDMWQAPPRPSPAKAPDQSFASTKADPDAEPPDPEHKKKMADAGTEPPPPDASTGEETPDADKAEPTDANPIEASDKPPGTTQEGDPNGVKDGTETDPLKVNAARMYNARLVSFFNRFAAGKCAGAEGTSTSASVTLSGTTVSSIHVSSSGNAAFDAAIPPAMQAAVGQSDPPPPENFPEFLKPSFSFTIVCK